jgi:hypothetical protein
LVFVDVHQVVEKRVAYMQGGLLAQPPICRNAPAAAQRRGGSGALAG